MELEGKTALITGSSRGIGAACALALAREGADVALNYRQSKERAEQVAADIRALGRSAQLIQADVTVPDQVYRLIAQAKEGLGHIDILINNAGYHAITRYTLADLTVEQWQQSIDANLTSMLLCTQALVPGMVERGWGRIVNISSVSAYYGSRSGDICYVASKRGVDGLTAALFRQLAPQGVTINSVAPGVIDTEVTRQLITSPEALQGYLQHIPMGRMGTAEEVADVVAFLASPRASYITGQVIHVNGGSYT